MPLWGGPCPKTGGGMVISVGILGAGGRMGRMVAEILCSDYSESASLAARCGRGDSHQPLLNTDVVIDFSKPAATLALLEHGARLPPLLSGTTGWTPAQHRQLLDHAKGSGNLNWDDEAATGTRIGEVLALVGATTEYQFG